MRTRTIQNTQVALLVERDFYSYMHQADENDLTHQRDLVAAELSRPVHQDVRSPVLELMRERLGILNQALLT
jgi:hypothetical protein